MKSACGNRVCSNFNIEAPSDPSHTAQLPLVGFGELTFSASEDLGGRLATVVKENENSETLFLILRALTFNNFNNLPNRTLPSDLENCTLEVDPAECKLLDTGFCSYDVFLLA